MIYIGLKNKILDNFEGSLKDIQRDLLDLNKSIEKDEKLNIETKTNILSSAYVLETAVYRAVLYNYTTELVYMKNQIQNLNSALNTMVKKSDSEFVSLINFRIIALLTFMIDYTN